MTINLSSLVSYLLEHRVDFGAAILLVIGAASALIKALEVLVSLLVGIFPGLKGADGELRMVAAWIDKLSGLGALNWLAATPAPKAVPAPKPAAPVAS